MFQCLLLDWNILWLMASYPLAFFAPLPVKMCDVHIPVFYSGAVIALGN